MKERESHIQKAIVEYLEYRDIFHYRNNSGAFKREDGHFYRFGAKGSPDIVCVIDGKFVGIEVKRYGGKQSDYQKDFQSNLEAAGGRYLLAYSVEDVHNALTKQVKGG